MSGLDGLAENLEFNVKQMYSKMSDEDAVKFADELAKNNVPDKIKEITNNITSLKSGFNI